jgi:hypothetical protein
MTITTLRPGLLVAVRTSIKGNVHYSTKDLPLDFQAYEDSATVAAVTKWETTKVVADPEEQERATKARSNARSAIQTVCAKSDFGLLCPLDKEAKLDAALDVALAIVREFNDTTNITKLSFNVLRGKIEADDVRAIRAINQEMRDLVDAMGEGMRNLDVETIRNAANKARSVSQMLTPQAQERIKGAIDLARKTAREIVKAGETGAAEVDRLAIAKLSEARTAFLDVDIAGDVQAPEAAAPVAVDFEPERKTSREEYQSLLASYGVEITPDLEV